MEDNFSKVHGSYTNPDEGQLQYFILKSNDNTHNINELKTNKVFNFSDTEYLSFGGYREDIKKYVLSYFVTTESNLLQTILKNAKNPNTNTIKEIAPELIPAKKPVGFLDEKTEKPKNKTYI